MVSQTTRVEGNLTTLSHKGSEVCFAVNKMYNFVNYLENHRFIAKKGAQLRSGLKQAHCYLHIFV